MNQGWFHSISLYGDYFYFYLIARLNNKKNPDSENPNYIYLYVFNSQAEFSDIYSYFSFDNLFQILLIT